MLVRFPCFLFLGQVGKPCCCVFACRPGDLSFPQIRAAMKQLTRQIQRELLQPRLIKLNDVTSQAIMFLGRDELLFLGRGEQKKRLEQDETPRPKCFLVCPGAPHHVFASGAARFTVSPFLVLINGSSSSEHSISSHRKPTSS